MVKEACDRARRGARARGRADDPVLLARREAEHDQVVGAHRPGRLRHHRDHRARRHERHRQLRAAVQPRVRRPAHPVHPPAEVARASAIRSTPRRTSCSRRCARSPASPRCRPRSPLTSRPRPSSRPSGRPPTRTALAKASADRRQHGDLGPGRQLRAAADDDGLAARLRPVRRARRRAADQPAVLPDRLHQAAAVHGRRRRARRTARRPSTCSASSGG